MTVTINGTTGIAGTNGSAGTPAVQGEDTNTGIFFPAADTVAVATGGAERLRADSSGNVGIGTTSPTSLLHVLSTGDTVARVTSGDANTAVLDLGKSSDTDGGRIAYDSGNNLLLHTASAERVRINSSGNVGIGTTSPSKKLHLAGTAGSSAILLAKTDSGASTLGQIGFSTVNGTVAGIDATAVTDSNNGALRFWTTGGSPQSDVTSLSERARIDSSGVLTVGQTSSINVFSGSADGCSIEGDGAISLSRNQNASLYIRRRGNNGAVAAFLRDTTQVGRIDVTTTATAYVTSSDYRLKENVAPMQNALDTVAQLNPVTYTWKADGSAGQGFIAHELQAVVPDCVTGEKDAVDAEGNPQYQGVDTSFLVATLVKAIQELTARIAILEAK